LILKVNSSPLKGEGEEEAGAAGRCGQVKPARQMLHHL